MEVDSNQFKQILANALAELLPALLLQSQGTAINPFTAETRLNERQVSQLSGLSLSTIQHYRTSGDGPIFEKLGRRVLYRYADILLWLSARKADSTAQVAARSSNARYRNEA